jgi:PAS domain S-box-containing protein
MVNDTLPPLSACNEDVALRSILEGTATETGDRFFAALVQNLAAALNTHGAWVMEYLAECRRLRALAFWLGGTWLPGYEAAVDGTPCQAVVDGRRLVHYPDKVVELYPDDPDLRHMGAVSYMGVPLFDGDGNVMGNLAVLDTRPMPEERRVLAVFRIFAARAAAELRRLRAEEEVREREERLRCLVDSAMDAIIELDSTCRVTRMNRAAERLLGCGAAEVVGGGLSRFLANGGNGRLTTLIRDLDTHPEQRQHLWVPGALAARRVDGETCQTEATLSRFEVRRQTFYTLILRNLHDRLEAERRIRSLTVEAEYLREEIRALHNFDELLGRSAPMERLSREMEQVAPTETTVLILGETGTGKQLVARALHAASRRRDRPFVSVNCAAIPATLMESEFFGHERGAFTGATRRREGRFALADGGTLFLDEVGELPLDLQGKLLRVLQEGEFEPVGSSHTRRVDVRILAATNRDLSQAIQAGEFRKDLFYRLNVFPLHVPPLRERGEDIPLLAAVFAQRQARRLGRSIEPLSREAMRRLQAYSWPGNVRELANVMERAVITARNGQLNLDRALPEEPAEPITARPASRPPPEEAPVRVRTVQEMRDAERVNLLTALEAARWRVTGEQGAARLLDMKPTTLSSRMKALGITRPR